MKIRDCVFRIFKSRRNIYAFFIVPLGFFEQPRRFFVGPQRHREIDRFLAAELFKIRVDNGAQWDADFFRNPLRPYLDLRIRFDADERFHITEVYTTV